MKLPPFEYCRPGSLPDALQALNDQGEDAKILAGGQSLLPLMAFRLARPVALVDLADVPELRRLAVDDGALSVGAMTTHAEIEDSEAVSDHQPLLTEAVRWIGHRPIRNRGTLGGSLAHADPAGELPLAALVLDARIEVASARGTRTIGVGAFFEGFLETALEADEITTNVSFPRLPPRTGTGFDEVARRHGDFAMVSAAAIVTLAEDRTISQVRLGLGAVSSQPIRVPEVEAALIGVSADGADGAAGGVAAALRDLPDLLDPPNDLHATAGYRRRLARTLAARAVEQAMERAATDMEES